MNKFLQPEYALVCNGAILLCNGEIDRQWKADTQKIIHMSEEPMRVLQDACKDVRLKCADGMFLYCTPTENINEAENILKTACSGLEISVIRSGRKIYCIPEKIEKGNSVSRFINLYGCKHTISSGDSELDISMLNRTDISMVPKRISRYVNAEKKIIIGEDMIFSDAIFSEIKSWTN